MYIFAIEILKSILEMIGLPVEIWDKTTGCSLSGRGTYHLTFNHFRPLIHARGLNTHKDSGWVTILRSIKPGLQVMRKGNWVPIIPESGYFIVNFGCAMEILTQKMKWKVAAVAHRVIEQTKDENSTDCFSYTLFVDSSLDPSICNELYSYSDENGLVVEKNISTFIDSIFPDERSAVFLSSVLIACVEIYMGIHGYFGITC